jgi:hypothetical protein
MRGVKQDGCRLRDQGWHVGCWDSSCCAIVEDDEILRGRVGVQRDIHKVPARLCSDEGLMSRTLVPGGYGSLMAGLSSRCGEKKRPPSYLIVG